MASIDTMGQGGAHDRDDPASPYLDALHILASVAGVGCRRRTGDAPQAAVATPEGGTP